MSATIQVFAFRQDKGNCPFLVISKETDTVNVGNARRQRSAQIELNIACAVVIGINLIQLFPYFFVKSYVGISIGIAADGIGSRRVRRERIIVIVLTVLMSFHFYRNRRRAFAVFLSKTAYVAVCRDGIRTVRFRIRNNKVMFISRANVFRIIGYECIVAYRNIVGCIRRKQTAVFFTERIFGYNRMTYVTSVSLYNVFYAVVVHVFACSNIGNTSNGVIYVTNLATRTFVHSHVAVATTVVCQIVIFFKRFVSVNISVSGIIAVFTGRCYLNAVFTVGRVGICKFIRIDKRVIRAVIFHEGVFKNLCFTNSHGNGNVVIRSTTVLFGISVLTYRCSARCANAIKHVMFYTAFIRIRGFFKVEFARNIRTALVVSTAKTFVILDITVAYAVFGKVNIVSLGVSMTVIRMHISVAANGTRAGNGYTVITAFTL